jgi:Cyclophilin type peptidyl-prolyl cis-trans isomerase/CLD
LYHHLDNERRLLTLVCVAAFVLFTLPYLTVSSVYHTEPPTHGKVLLRTTYGDIDIELWPKEAPKACRNFVQLALDGVSAVIAIAIATQ